jgi:ketosteroid isomerase-like protein
MKGRIVCVLLVSSLLASLAWAGTLKDYQAKSPDEEAIKSVLLHWQNSGNSGDVAGVLSVLTDDFQIYDNWPGKNAEIKNKKEYEAVLPERMKRNPTVIVGLPEIAVTGNRATVKAPLDTTRGELKATFYLERQHEKWLVRKFEWSKIRGSGR